LEAVKLQRAHWEATKGKPTNAFMKDAGRKAAATRAEKGIGRAILMACENEARAYGFRRIELMATLPGVPLYKTCGYRGTETFDLELSDGLKLELLPMRKELAQDHVS